MYKRKRYSSANKYIKRARLAYKVGRAVYKGYQSYRKRTNASPGITNQYDVKTIYSRKRMPIRRRRQWKRFVRKVEAVTEKGKASFTQIFNGLGSNTAAAGIQQVQFYWLFGKKGTEAGNEKGCNDLANIAALMNPTIDDNSKFIVKSAVMDITMQNASADICTLEVDVYHCVLWNENKEISMGASVTTSEANTPALSGTSLLMSQRGVTPFDMPQLIRYTGMKIMKKTKYFLSNGQTATYQIRDPRRHVFSSLDILNGVDTVQDARFIEPGKTQGLFIIFKTTPGDISDSGILYTGCSRKYAVLRDESNLYSDKYN